MGLLLSGRDIALRVTQDAHLEELSAQLGVTLPEHQGGFRYSSPGQRWWRLGPLTEAELWQAKDFIHEAGLEPVRGELRHGRMGRWRFCVFFSAVGDPRKTYWDTGARTSSEARLDPSTPPPRQSTRPSASTPRTSVAPAASRPRAGPALAPSSNWAGPRSAASSTPSSPAATTSTTLLPGSRRSPSPSPPAQPAAATSLLPRRQPRTRNVHFSGASPASTPATASSSPSADLCAQLRRLGDQLAQVMQQNAALLSELASLRAENAALRQQIALPPAILPHLLMLLLQQLPAAPLAPQCTIPPLSAPRRL